jgi:hypothetical protein
MKIIDCKDFSCAWASLQHFLNLEDTIMNSLVSQYEKSIINNNCFPDINDVIEINNISIPTENIVCFYHFTKCLCPKKLERGLYPLHKIVDELLSDLFVLANDTCETNKWEMLTKQFKSCIKFSSSSRLISDDGPNGFLIREFGLSKQKGHVYYLDNSEFIEDFLTYMKSNGIDLIAKHNLLSKRCIVKFKIENIAFSCIKSYINSVFCYLALKMTNNTIDNCNSSYWNKGNEISSKNIIDIEILD